MAVHRLPRWCALGLLRPLLRPLLLGLHGDTQGVAIALIITEPLLGSHQSTSDFGVPSFR
jgi:hypothetical protein